jgi:hypothetical protein
MQRRRPSNKTRPKLTEKDRPFLLNTLTWWKEHFPFELEAEELIIWVETYPYAVIEKGLNATAGWYKRQLRETPVDPNTLAVVDPGPPNPSEESTYRYASACMRNIQRARNTMELLLGGVR